MKIDDMDLIVRVADAGSMTRAARQVHRTPAAVSAAVQRVERALGVRLFVRTTRTLHTTDEGRAVIEGCRDILARWRRTLDDAHDRRTELAGTVHLSAPTDTSYAVLQPLLPVLHRAHPRLRVVLAASDGIRHLQREAIDLAIRYGPLGDSGLHARKLAEEPLILVAAPAYLEARGAPARLGDLAHHPCITHHTAGQAQTHWTLHEGRVRRSVALDSPLCGDGFLARRWAVAGTGIALKSLFDVVDDLEAGRLLRVLPGVSGGDGAIHAVFPGRRFQPARVRAVTEAIARAFAARSARCRAWRDPRPVPPGAGGPDGGRPEADGAHDRSGGGPIPGQ